ncbi:MAG: hypothetical protein OEU94_08200, partial [Aquincola sp.]|nr:hypothetical protein [Aquincola sp.]
VGAVNAQWAREALGASLLHTQSMFTVLQAMQQAQARMLHDASADIEGAIEALRAAEDGSALAAVPARLFNAQWQHSLENVAATAGRLMEIESAWLQQAQSQAAQHWAAMPSGSGAEALRAAIPVADKRLGDGVDAAWQQWSQRWQDSVGEMSRAWSEAVGAAQARA